MAGILKIQLLLKNLMNRNKLYSKFLLFPIYILSILFILIPLIYMVYLSFMTRGDIWGFKNIFTLENYKTLLDPFYLNIFYNSIKLSVISVFFIILIGYPFGYFMAKQNDKWKKRIMFLIMLPFWTSGLIRLYGWVIVFRSNGTLDKILMALNITEKPLKLLYSYNAVVLGMIYALLPFMILSVYSSVEKMDWSLVDAARDLGASKWRAFYTITFPMTLSGLLSGIVLTFVPSMGLFFVAEILGGNKIVLVGNVIQDLLSRGNNQPLAAAISVILMLMTIITLFLYRKIAKTKKLEGLY